MPNPPSAARTRLLATAPFGGALLFALAPAAHAQRPIHYSVDWHGPTKSQPDSATLTPITEGDVLSTPGAAPVYGPQPPPRTVFNGGQLGLPLYTACVGSVPGHPCGVEVDALSFADDAQFLGPLPPPPNLQARLYFSVDRFAQGLATTAGSPSVRTEGPARDAAADVYVPRALLQPPVLPSAAPSNVQVLDGNGLPSATQAVTRGIGLREPHSVQPAPGPDLGDNLDALDIGPLPVGPTAAVYYSLDAGFSDPAGIPNSNSAQLNGFSPSAVLRKPIGAGTPVVYAQASQLGLHPVLDDLDALILAENGAPGFQPSLVPFDWNVGALGGSDMLLYSVRRGSAVIGLIDSLLGLPIEPGDVLTTPVAGGNGNPAIFIAAEALGLRTVRSGALTADELDAMASEKDPYFDCNGNGVEDAVDISTGFSPDANGNGIPDECERTYSAYCTCEVGLGPCGNDAPGKGCLNSLMRGGVLAGNGTTSCVEDDLLLDGSDLSNVGASLLFSGPNQTQVAFGDGLRCISSPVQRLDLQIPVAGVVSYGPGLLNQLCASYGVCLDPGDTYNFQVWYRNAPVYCTADTYNLSNGVSVTFSP